MKKTLLKRGKPLQRKTALTVKQKAKKKTSNRVKKVVDTSVMTWDELEAHESKQLGAKKKVYTACVNLAKLIAKERDEWTCQYCEKQSNGQDMHGSHVINEAKDHRLAIDTVNIKALCYNCHLHGWHKQVLIYAEWFENNFRNRSVYLKFEHFENKNLGSIPVSFWYKSLYDLIIEFSLLKEGLFKTNLFDDIQESISLYFIGQSNEERKEFKAIRKRLISNPANTKKIMLDE